MALVINKSAVIAASEKIEKILAERKASERKVSEALAADAKAWQKADSDMKNAVAKNDLEAFQKAKKALQDAKDSRELHEAWSKNMEEQPGITEAEYKSIVSAIYAELDALEHETLQKAVKLADEMAAAGDALRKAQEHANEVLQKLQHDVYKDADRMRSKGGEIIYTTSENKAVDKWETINFTQAAKNHFIYGAYMKRKP